MKLKFIGTDGSMGLKHGEVYNVLVEAFFYDSSVKVKWYDEIQQRTVHCPYSSPASFAADWAKPGKKVRVRKKSKPAESVEQCKWAWTEIGKDDYDKFWICPKCHEHTYIKTNYCPKCGCQMSGGIEKCE